MLVIGVLLLLVAFGLQAAPQTTNLPVLPSYLSITPTAIGGTSVTISWSAASPQTIVYLTSGTPSCVGPASVVGTGSGASGSFTASLSSGTTYALYACSPTTSGSLSTTTVGLTYLAVIGIVVTIVGAIVAVLGFRARPKAVAPASSPPSDESAEPEAAPYTVPRPMTAQEAGSASTGTTPVGMRQDPPEPVRFMPAYDPGPTNPSASAPAGGTPRPSRTCVFCGTVNESWITNCRKCKRPLSSTGDS